MIGVAAVVACAGGLWAGCGPAVDRCLGKECVFGTCESADGTCSNEEQCRVADDCLPGFECSPEGDCEPLNPCNANGDCATGQCREGGCVNPDVCEVDSNCFPRTYCEKSDGAAVGRCQPDPCRNKTCRRGVCERGTDRCVSRSSCRPETELLDCLSGEKCAGGECRAEEEFCEAIDCDRGVCSFEAGGCVDAAPCSSDRECLAGNFCDPFGRCRPDRCEQTGVQCGDEGVCRPTTGACENAAICEAAVDCVEDHVCVDGTCRLESRACGEAEGDGGCIGNQRCSYDAEELEARCREPAVCETSLDCREDRRCGGRTCLEPESCRPDRLEENDSGQTATPFAEAAADGTLSASICGGDLDFYEVETTEFVSGSTGGTLVVDLYVPDRDRGLGSVEFEVLAPDDDSLGRVDTGVMGRDGRARLTSELMASDHGSFTVRVSAGANLRETGVRYELSADVLPPEALAACRTAESIEVGRRLSGSTETGRSSAFGSTCTSERNGSPEQIYSVEVRRPRELTFELENTDPGADLAMSLRGRCSQRGSEVACVDAGGVGEDETLEEVVGPGTYALIVQSPEASAGGSFTLSLRSIRTTCAPSSNYCGEDGNARVCSDSGGRFRTVQCETSCDPTLGRCR